MSGEVAHQEAPAAKKEAARDLDPAKADEPAAAGALLLLGGARMLSPSHLAGLQGLVGNAGVAGMLRPRASAAPVIARQEAPDKRAAQWSHGWMAGSLKELAALPAAELAKVEGHAKDPDVDAKRFEIMLTAVRLSKSGGAKDWQLRDLYKQMQGASIPQDQQQEVATFVGAFGLFTPKAINEYVKDVGDIFTGWAELGSAEARAQAFGYLVNRQLGYQRVPPVKIVVAGIASGGEFDKDTWTITISTRLGALNLTPEQQSDLIRRAAANFLHEARHAEQIFTVARARAGAGSTPAAIATDLKIPPDIAGKAHGLKVAPGSPEAIAAKAWYESEFGAGKAHRDAVLGDLDKRNEEYKALPEEADAHALGIAVADRLQGGVPAPAGAAGGDAGAPPGGIQRQVSVQRCGPTHPDCGCPPETAEAAETAETTPAHALAVQRSPVNAVVIQRESREVENALTTPDKGIQLASLPKETFRVASDEQRFRAITLLLDNPSIRTDAAIPTVWDGFGAGLEAAVAARPAEWERSLKEKREITSTSYNFKGLRAVFFLDIVHVVNGYLAENDAYCKQELTKLGLDENGKIVAGPPTKEQVAELDKLRPAAQKVAADREAMTALRNIYCGWTLKESAPGGGVGAGGSHEGERMKFDPAREPPGKAVPGDGMKTWDEVNEHYQSLQKLVSARHAANPALAALDRESDEARAGHQSVATGSREDALTALGNGLTEVIKNIAETKKLLSPTVAEEYKPVHQQLMAGTVPKPHQPPRQWDASKFFKPTGQAILDGMAPSPAEIILKAVGTFAMYAMIGFVTGGVGLAAASLAADAVDLAVSAGKAEALATAGGTNVVADTALVTRGQVDEARAELIEKAAFAFLDVAGGISAGHGAIKEIVQFEKQAAAAAKRAQALAAKWIASEEKAVSAALLAETEAAAKEARTSADGAKAKVSSAAPEEAQRATVYSGNANKEAVAAEGVAADMKASLDGGHGKAGHADPVKVGEHSVGTRGVWVTRCSDAPCLELAQSVVPRAKAIFVKGPTRNPTVWAFNEQVTAVSREAEKLSKKAADLLEKHPIGHPERVKVEKGLNAEGAAIEAEMQRLEALQKSGFEGAGLAQGIHAAASLLERNLVSRANAIFPRMPRPPKGKCVAMGESGRPMISGYKYNPNAAADVGEHARIIDAALVENKSFDRGIPGQASASHSEKMAGIRGPGEPIAVALPMCPNCYAYFAQEARASGITQVVAEPHLTNVFFADGVRVSIDRTGARTVIGESGSISTKTTPAIPASSAKRIVP